MTKATLAVRVRPRARRNAIVGERASTLLVDVTAPPHEGKANEAVRKLIAKSAGVPRGNVTIVRGARSRDKLVRVEGVTEHELRHALGL